MNFMPCVAPVLLLKVRAFGQPGKRLPYLAGVMASFMGLATLSVTLGTGLSQMGLEPFRLTLGVVCGLMATHLLGWWHMPSFGVRGDWGPFGTGLLTVALGTSCSVPFLAPVMIYCGQAGLLETYLLFGALGVGFCGPFIVPIPIPKLFRGDWSLFFERACGVIMMLVAAWIFSTLNMTVATAGIVVVFCSVIWVKILSKTGRLLLVKIPMTIVLVGSIITSVAIISTDSPTIEPDQTWTTTGPRCIFFTADWCINCKAMYHTLDYPGMSYDMALAGIDGGVEVVDFTDQNSKIWAVLSGLVGSPSVPVLWIVRDDGVETILSGVWTVTDVRNALGILSVPDMRVK